MASLTVLLTKSTVIGAGITLATEGDWEDFFAALLRAIWACGTVREATINKYGDDCSSCRNLSPTVMVLGYSSDLAIGGLKQTMY